MEYDNKRAFVEGLRRLLVKHCGGCAIQDGADGKGWPCGTCVCALLGQVMDSKDPQYNEHNEEIDRINEVWRAILQIRDFA